MSYLIEVGLADGNGFAFQRSRSGYEEVTFKGANFVSIALRNQAYEEIYASLAEAGAYNVKMFDGALLQMSYRFENAIPHSHRLAFFPAPHRGDLSREPEIDLGDEIYSEVFRESIVSFPFRFDYEEDPLDGRANHPKSHLTLGQYENCRIPVSAPVTPSRFFDFVLRNFYHSAFERHESKLPLSFDYFGDSLSEEEKAITHLVVPDGL